MKPLQYTIEAGEAIERIGRETSTWFLEQSRLVPDEHFYAVALLTVDDFTVATPFAETDENVVRSVDAPPSPAYLSMMEWMRKRGRAFPERSREEKLIARRWEVVNWGHEHLRGEAARVPADAALGPWLPDGGSFVERLAKKAVIIIDGMQRAAELIREVQEDLFFFCSVADSPYCGWLELESAQRMNAAEKVKRFTAERAPSFEEKESGSPDAVSTEFLRIYDQLRREEAGHL